MGMAVVEAAGLISGLEYIAGPSLAVFVVPKDVGRPLPGVVEV